MGTVVSALRRRPLTLVLAATLGAAEAAYRFASPSVRAQVTSWASTNVTNLTHEPFGPLVASAFVIEQRPLLWLALTVLAALALERRIGWQASAAIIVAAHLLGTLVSQGVQWWRVERGALPRAALDVDDVGVSYVVLGLLCALLTVGSWRTRIAAAGVLAALADPLLEGITALDVTAVGHVTAATTGGVLGMWVARSRRRKQGGNPALIVTSGNRSFRSTRTFSQR